MKATINIKERPNVIEKPRTFGQCDNRGGHLWILIDDRRQRNARIKTWHCALCSGEKVSRYTFSPEE